MGQTLTNGIYLPNEGEVRCYDGLASNWTTLDAVVGGYRAHVADENIHITSAERNKWDNGVTQAYVLRYANTSLTALGTVAFSALDNTDNIKIGDKVLDSEGKLFALTAVDTANSTATLSALLIDLADDSGVVHKAGNETIDGKTFKSSSYFYNSTDGASTPSLYIRSNKAVIGDSSGTNSDNTRISFLDKNNQLLNYIQCRKVSNGSSDITFYVGSKDANDNSISSSVTFFKAKDGSSVFRATVDNDVSLGNNSYKFKDVRTYQINGINPSGLSLPNYAQRMDISGYITDLTGGNNTYTPVANGYIYIRTDTGLKLEILDVTSGIGSSSIVQSSDRLIIFLPVVAQRHVYIKAKCTSLVSAVFVPCFGNLQE